MNKINNLIFQNNHKILMIFKNKIFYQLKMKGLDIQKVLRMICIIENFWMKKGKFLINVNN